MGDFKRFSTIFGDFGWFSSIKMAKIAKMNNSESPKFKFLQFSTFTQIDLALCSLTLLNFLQKVKNERRIKENSRKKTTSDPFRLLTTILGQWESERASKSDFDSSESEGQASDLADLAAAKSDNFGNFKPTNHQIGNFWVILGDSGRAKMAKMAKITIFKHFKMANFFNLSLF